MLGSVPLAMSEAYGDSLSFGLVSLVLSVGSRLLVADAFTDPHLAEIDLNTGEVTRRFGRRGSGPTEFRDPDWGLVESIDPPHVWIYDFQNRRFSLVDLDRHPNPIIDEFSLRAPMPVENPLIVGDEIISTGLFPDHTLTIFSKEGVPLRNLAANPPFDATRLPHAVGRSHMNRTFMAFHPERDRLALAYQFDNRIDFFTTEGSRYGSTRGPTETTPQFRIEGNRFFDDGNEMAYGPARGTNTFVYVMFCGCKDMDNPDIDRIHIFGWDGVFVGEIRLDHPIVSFTVSPDDRFLFGAIQDPYPAVGKWRLPEELREDGALVDESSARSLDPYQHRVR